MKFNVNDPWVVLSQNTDLGHDRMVGGACVCKNRNMFFGE